MAEAAAARREEVDERGVGESEAAAEAERLERGGGVELRGDGGREAAAAVPEVEERELDLVGGEALDGGGEILLRDEVAVGDDELGDAPVGRREQLELARAEAAAAAERGGELVGVVRREHAEALDRIDVVGKQRDDKRLERRHRRAARRPRAPGVARRSPRTSGGAASPLSSASSSRRAFAASRSLMSRTAVDHGPHHPSPRSSAVSACPPIRNPCIRGSRAGGAGAAAGRQRRRRRRCRRPHSAASRRVPPPTRRVPTASARRSTTTPRSSTTTRRRRRRRRARAGAAGFLPSAFDIGAAAFALPLPLGGRRRVVVGGGRGGGRRRPASCSCAPPASWPSRSRPQSRQSRRASAACGS